jgi:putative hydrolase
MDPARTLRRIAFQLERSGAPTFKVRAFRKAADLTEHLPSEELAEHVRRGTLTRLPGIGAATAAVISDAINGREPAYLRRLVEDAASPVAGGQELRAALRGDCHTHSDWSDGGSPIEEMAATARELGHEWIALTDHSPRLRVAGGLSADRLRRQLDVVAGLNLKLAPFRVLTGIEVDILPDGGLDQEDDLLAELDVVVASVHSQLRMPKQQMTRRLLTALANPHVDVLGHCTGRIVSGSRTRPESVFDADAVFAACREHGVAVEINSRPERLDPPRRLITTALDAGCVFAIDSDAHAPGQLDWLPYGCDRAQRCGVPAERVINTRSADGLLGFTDRRTVRRK